MPNRWHVQVFLALIGWQHFILTWCSRTGIARCWGMSQVAQESHRWRYWLLVVVVNCFLNISGHP